VSCRVVSCRVVSCRVVSCRVVSCRVVSCRVASRRVVSVCAALKSIVFSYCNQDGDTALLLACATGHIEVARWLVAVARSDVQSERDNVSVAVDVCVFPALFCCSVRGDVFD
jgi:hypothetical protein